MHRSLIMYIHLWLSFINSPLLRSILPFLLLLSKRYSRPKTWHIEAIICIDEIAILKTCHLCATFVAMGSYVLCQRPRQTKK